MSEETTTQATDTPNAEVVDKTTADKMYGESTKEAPKETTEAPKEGEAKESSEQSKEDKPKEDSVETKTKKDEQKEEPKDIKLKAPKDSGLSTEQVQEVEEFAKANGLTQEAAEALLERDHKLLQSIKEQQHEQLVKVSEDWRKEVESDKVYGGENLKQTAFYSSQALQKFGSEDLRQGLIDTGFGNHPEVVKFFAKVGKAFAPGTFEKQGMPPVQKKSAEEQLYGNSTK